MHDVIAARGEQHEGKALLQPVMEGGHILDPAFADASAAREYAREAVDELPGPVKSLEPLASPYQVRISPRLSEALDSARGRWVRESNEDNRQQ
jgi:hypothetical protein